MWRSASDGSERTSSSKSRASRARPRANVHFDRRLDRVDELVRGKPAAVFRRHHLVRLRDDERRGEQRDALGAMRAVRAETRRLGAYARYARDQRAAPPSTASPSTTSSRMPFALRLVGATLSPLSMISSAACAPIRRGKRCVPPAPGSRPSLISGKPDLRAAGRDRDSRTRARVRGRRRARSRRSPPRTSSRCVRRRRSTSRIVLVSGLGSVGEVVDVRAAAEDAVRAGEDDRAYRRVGLGRFERREQVGRERERRAR